MSVSDFDQSMREFLTDPDRARFAQQGDPHTWQQQLEDRIEAIGRRGADLTERIQQVEAEAKDRNVSVRVGAGGTLLGMAFLPAAGQLDKDGLATAFMTQYQAACADVNQQVADILAESGMSVTDFNPFASGQMEEE